MLALISLRRERQSLPGVGWMCLFYSRAKSSVTGENSRFKVHPSLEAVTEMLMKGELLTRRSLEKNLSS